MQAYVKEVAAATTFVLSVIECFSSKQNLIALDIPCNLNVRDEVSVLFEELVVEVLSGHFPLAATIILEDENVIIPNLRNLSNSSSVVGLVSLGAPEIHVIPGILDALATWSEGIFISEIRIIPRHINQSSKLSSYHF